MSEVFFNVFDTPLGPMRVIACNKAVYGLEFVEQTNLPSHQERLSRLLKKNITEGSTPITDALQGEVRRYFQGQLNIFKTPVHIIGTPFQQQVWKALQAIPYGKTHSYSKLSCILKKPTAYRAVAQANRANKLALIIPCHRVINKSGHIAGYAGGVSRKQWLLAHEQGQ